MTIFRGNPVKLSDNTGVSMRYRLIFIAALWATTTYKLWLPNQGGADTCSNKDCKRTCASSIWNAGMTLNGAPSWSGCGVPSRRISVGFWILVEVPVSSRSSVTFQAGSLGLGMGSSTAKPVNTIETLSWMQLIQQLLIDW